MSAGTVLAAVSPVLADGVLMCSLPAVTRPTLQFGVRVPRERAGAQVVRRERRAYYWRTAAIGACCTAVAVLVQGHWPSLLTRLILLPELAAGYGCFCVARRRIDGGSRSKRSTAGSKTPRRRLAPTRRLSSSPSPCRSLCPA